MRRWSVDVPTRPHRLRPRPVLGACDNHPCPHYLLLAVRAFRLPRAMWRRPPARMDDLGGSMMVIVIRRSTVTPGLLPSPTSPSPSPLRILRVRLRQPPTAFLPSATDLCVICDRQNPTRLLPCQPANMQIAICSAKIARPIAPALIATQHGSQKKIVSVPYRSLHHNKMLSWTLPPNRAAVT